MLGDAAAEDVASETMIRVAQRLSEGLDPAVVEDLVPVIAYGLAANEYRRGEIPAGLGTEDDWLGELIVSKARTFDQETFAGDFDSTIRHLPGDELRALVLTDLRGLTVREAADVLGTSHMTVHRRRENARLNLRERIAA